MQTFFSIKRTGSNASWRVALIILLATQSLDAAEAPSANATCIACHGEAGISSNDLWPNLAGQKRGYLQAQLHAFKNGQRVNELMTPIARLLSETDITSLSLYYSNLSAKAGQ